MAKDEGKIELVAQWLEKQRLDSTLTDGRIWQELAMSERTFYRIKPKAVELLNKRLKETVKAVEQAKTLEAVEGAKNGIKTKNERVLILQGQVDELLKDLETEGISPTDKAYLRKTIKDIQAEISKIEGDYAPEKHAQTNTKGEDLSIDYTKLPDDVLEAIIASAKNDTK